MSELPSAPSLSCPRCGYDLSALPPTWLDACPLTCTCSECGTALPWADVFDPARQNAPGFIEHETGNWISLLRAALITLTWTLFPFRFWQRIRVEYRIVPRRMFLWLAILILPAHALASIFANIRFFLVQWSGPGSPTARTYLYDHISAWTFPLLGFREIVGTSRPRLVFDFAGTPAYIWFALAAHATYFLTMWVLPTTRKLAKLRSGHLVRAFIYGLAWLSLLTWFRAVRNAHILWQIFMSPPGVVSRSGSRWVSLPILDVVRLSDFFPELVGILLILWICLWWAAAMHQGWRIHRCGLVWLLLTIAALLAGCAAAAWSHELTLRWSA